MVTLQYLNEIYIYVVTFECDGNNHNTQIVASTPSGNLAK